MMELANRTERRAYRIINRLANYYIAGCENTISDYDEHDEEYIEAKATLDDHKSLVKDIYDMCMDDDDIGLDLGFASTKDIRFCGKKRIMEMCEAVVCACGY